MQKPPRWLNATRDNAVMDVYKQHAIQDISKDASSNTRTMMQFMKKQLIFNVM